jgi:acyl-CoA reductase-like NAD-dependent aldehyde dehydrogenase
MANAAEYGLSSSVFMRDFERGLEFAKKVVAGTHPRDSNQVSGLKVGGNIECLR